MKYILFFLFILGSVSSYAQLKMNMLETSQEMLSKIQEGTSVDDIVEMYSKVSLDDLNSQLITDQDKLAFWVNFYNGFIQYELKKNPGLYENRGAFFNMARIDIAGQKLSFADLEHGIIRRSQSPIMLGYFKRWFRPKWERELRVSKRDWRVHFALNCGAKSCPPVAIYNSENLSYQFDFMTEKYLKEQTEYFADEQKAETMALFSWFRGDFGGFSGAKKILYEYKITPEKPKKLTFTNYDWTLLLDNFREIPTPK